MRQSILGTRRPLLNSAGEMIGINAQIVSPNNKGGSIGIGFAIPVDTVKRVVSDLITFKYVRRPYVGIGQLFPMENYPPAVARRIGVPPNDGYMIVQVAPSQSGRSSRPSRYH
jgi:S1-C subfamily serine protease